MPHWHNDTLDSEKMDIDVSKYSSDQVNLFRLVRWKCNEDNVLLSSDELEQQLVRMASSHPEVFSQPLELQSTSETVFPLTVLFRDGLDESSNDECMRVSLPAFEACYQAYPPALVHSTNRNEFCLASLVCSSHLSYRLDRMKDVRYNEMVHAVARKSWRQLAMPYDKTTSTQLLIYMVGKVSEEVLRECIQNYPGPIADISNKYNESLLLNLATSPYSFECFQWVYGLYPKAVELIQQACYRQTVLHLACTARNDKKALFTLQKCSEASSISDKEGDFPLQKLVQGREYFAPYQSSSDGNLVEALVRVFPMDMFSGTYDRKYACKKAPCPLSRIWMRLAAPKQILPPVLCLFLDIYRYGNKFSSDEAWKCPSFPVHVGTSE